MYGKFVWMLLVALTIVALPALALAAAGDPEAIAVVAPDIDWTQIPSQVMVALTKPVIVGIGIALSVWVIFTGINFFRRSVRG